MRLRVPQPILCVQHICTGNSYFQFSVSNKTAAGASLCTISSADDIYIDSSGGPLSGDYIVTTRRVQPCLHGF
eukprot:4595781-Amphidinium_carterae.1